MCFPRPPSSRIWKQWMSNGFQSYLRFAYRRGLRRSESVKRNARLHTIPHHDVGKPDERTVTRKIGRNDPCPCGSGKKYKKCHGAVVAVQPAARRACGTCTACCDGWVVGTIRGHEMKPGQPCHFRGEGCCTIYERRPVDPCRNFVCGWLQEESPFPEEFKP